ncbi:MAG: adenosylhomocysteinase [Candidatus Aenigmarchaeota archaeon]|nr:adenosylhomocysteinase [Candidatus Aenigmarchaeota archaeon]
MSRIKDPSLAPKGRLKIEWCEDHMPVLMDIKKRYEKEKPLEGLKIGACLHITKETAVLLKVLKAGGAEVFACGSNPLSTQDDVAAALAKDGINVYAWRGVNTNEYYECVDEVLDNDIDITMDDGADLTTRLHTKRKEKLEKVMGGTEETTTGVIRFRAMEKDGALKYPVVAVNDSYTKYLFDNRYGTGQSSIDGLLRATSVMIAGTNFVVGGYGWCSRGVAMRAKGMGANVIVTEVNPVRALEAVMDGFRVMPMIEAVKIADVIITATGDKGIVRKEHFQKIKNGCILANTGHFDNEIDLKALDSMTTNKREIRTNTVEYTLPDGRKVYILAEGRLVNLAAAEGHPPEVMDMSFANQAFAAEYIKNNGDNLEGKVYTLPPEYDRDIASIKLKSMNVHIDELTDEQKAYLTGWKEGT